MGDNESIDDVANDFLESLGLSDKPLDPNDQFWNEFTSGGTPKIALVRYWLISEMDQYHHLKALNINITKNVMKDGKIIARPVSQLDYGKAMVKYYLQMYHLPRFSPGFHTGRDPADMNNIVERIVAHGPVREIIEKIPE